MDIRLVYFMFFVCIKLCSSYRTQNSHNDTVVFKNVTKKHPHKAKKFAKYRSQKIVGGVPADEHVAPWMVSLQFGTRVKIHICGGTIIAPDWILTAGHCVDKHAQLEVVAGRHDLKANESETEQRRYVWRVFVHPHFKGGVGANDIGLIQLKTPLEYTSAVSEARLPNEWTDENGLGQLYGWGSMSRTRFPINPSVLQTINAPIITNEQCKKQVLHYGSIVRDTNLCTDSLNGLISSCNGDSGSALLKHDVVIGIVSWGLKPCGIPGSASVFTRVSSYQDWITGIVGKREKTRFTFDISDEADGTSDSEESGDVEATTEHTTPKIDASTFEYPVYP